LWHFSYHLTLGKTHHKLVVMSTTVTIDKAGRLVLPKSIRQELHLEPGDKIELDSEGGTLRPVRETTPLRKERGVWVFRRGAKLTAAATDKALRELREKRDRDNLGNLP
jgi:AbrB family looped-hinge helix DNA binding protein